MKTMREIRDMVIQTIRDYEFDSVIDETDFPIAEYESALRLYRAAEAAFDAGVAELIEGIVQKIMEGRLEEL